MIKSKTMYKIRVLFLAGVLTAILWGGLWLLPAKSQQLQFRIDRLESNLNRLQVQVNQLQSQSQSSRKPNSRNIITKRSQTSRSSLPANQAQMFDRMATLVVELKQQINALERRVEKLEKSN